MRRRSLQSTSIARSTRSAQSRPLSAMWWCHISSLRSTRIIPSSSDRFFLFYYCPDNQRNAVCGQFLLKKKSKKSLQIQKKSSPLRPLFAERTAVHGPESGKEKFFENLWSFFCRFEKSAYLCNPLRKRGHLRPKNEAEVHWKIGRTKYKQVPILTRLKSKEQALVSLKLRNKSWGSS